LISSGRAKNTNGGADISVSESFRIKQNRKQTPRPHPTKHPTRYQIHRRETTNREEKKSEKEKLFELFLNHRDRRENKKYMVGVTRWPAVFGAQNGRSRNSLNETCGTKVKPTKVTTVKLDDHLLKSYA